MGKETKKDIMMEHYVRDLTLPCREGKQTITGFKSLGDVKKSLSRYKENEVIEKIGHIIVITDKEVNIYRYGWTNQNKLR